jgi:hypothetical protein
MPQNLHHHQAFAVAEIEPPLHLLEPSQLAAQPFLLLTFAMDWETSLCVEPYNLTAMYFLQHGHRAASFDLPNHGTRINQYGEAITGLRNAFIGGKDPFALFIEEAEFAIDFCIDRGFATIENIAVCGTSRAGYLALRLLGNDDRIAAAAAFAPVTDWRCLEEFEADQNREDVAALQLSNYVQNLAGKSTFIAIGNKDERVSTASCQQFYIDLLNANNGNDENIHFQIDDSPGHYSQNEWYLSGAQFLINALQDHVK